MHTERLQIRMVEIYIFLLNFDSLMNSCCGHWIVCLYTELCTLKKKQSGSLEKVQSSDCHLIIRWCLGQTVVWFGMLAPLANPGGKGLVSSYQASLVFLVLFPQN